MIALPATSGDGATDFVRATSAGLAPPDVNVEELLAAFGSGVVAATVAVFATVAGTLADALTTNVRVVVNCAPSMSGRFPNAGPLDLVRHGENGYLYPPDDVDQLRGAVRRLVADAPLRERLGAAARLSVEGRSWDVLGDQLIGHYEQVSGMAHTRQRVA